MPRVLSMALLLALLHVPRAQAQGPASELVVEGTVVSVQQGMPLCGTLATAGWVVVEVDRIVRSSRTAAALPRRVRVMVRCRAASAGRRYRFTLHADRPTRASWEMFSVLGPPPRDDLPLFWAIEHRELHAP